MLSLKHCILFLVNSATDPTSSIYEGVYISIVSVLPSHFLSSCPSTSQYPSLVNCYYQTLLNFYYPIHKSRNPFNMDQQLPWTVGDIPDWLDIDVANSVFGSEYGPRPGLPPPTQPEQAGLYRHQSAVRYSLFMGALEEEEKKEPAPGPSTLAAESPSQARWRKAEEASESRALKKIRNRSGRASKDGQKRTRKMTERTRELRRGKYLGVSRVVDVSRHD